MSCQYSFWIGIAVGMSSIVAALGVGLWVGVTVLQRPSDPAPLAASPLDAIDLPSSSHSASTTTQSDRLA